jgi:putative aldouronate transport system substrate-binding protein
MVEADMLLELGPIWDEYAHPKWKAAVAEMGDAAWKDVTVNGKRYGIPRIAMAAQDDTILWIRQDWLDELGLEAPTTLDELHDVALAFVEANLGPGSETVGIAASDAFHNTWYGSLDPIWGGYGISTNWSQFGWSEAPDGSLQYDGIRPEAREALILLNQWYEDGLFRKDFFAIGRSDAISDISAGDAGLHFTPIWGPNRDAVENDGAVWAFYDIPAGPAGQHKFSAIPIDGSFVVAKDFAYAKEWIEMTNWRIEMEEAADNRMHGWEGMDYLLEDGEYVYQDMDYTFWTVGPLGTRYGGFADPQSANETLKYRLEEWSQIPEGERDAYQAFFFADPINVLRSEAQVFIGEKTVEQGLIDKYQGPETPTMVTNWSDLLTLESETYLSIISGEKPIEAFDEFVADWKAGGGDQITAEVNEWWQAQNP